LKPWARDRVEEFCKLPFVNKEKVWKDWDLYHQGAMDNSFYLWQWINLSYLKPDTH
jgi:hypothetical protein